MLKESDFDIQMKLLEIQNFFRESISDLEHC